MQVVKYMFQPHGDDRGQLIALEEFKDIPVIFLTGNRDLDRMIKVMPLNPAGYLLKYLKPEEIKKKIDAFFEKRKKA